ncbi:MAG: hypothetical protein KAT34_17470 [Candidatus Aminicenantes bacterium]|nr:hypothetical protein [Candidatus Aminicenantes bacterium]
MKKTFTLILIVLCFSVLIPAKTFTITIHGNYFTIADPDISDLYGKKKYFPEGKISLKIAGNFFVWSSYGTFSSGNSWLKWSHKGLEEADIEVNDTLNKTIISGGLGYYVGYIEKDELAVKIEAGVCKITNTEETVFGEIAGGSVITSEKETHSGIGIRGNLGVTYGLYKNFFAEAIVGYLYATAKVGDYTVNLGGLRLSLGLGLRF